MQFEYFFSENLNLVDKNNKAAKKISAKQPEETSTVTQSSDDRKHKEQEFIFSPKKVNLLLKPTEKV